MIRLISIGSGIFLVGLMALLGAHEGHHDVALLNPESPFSTSHNVTNWLGWIGRFHFLFLHFPIALIVMTVVAEWLHIWYNQLIFEYAARFMLIAAAFFAPVTALLGFALGYGQTYDDFSLDLYEWHRYFGVITAGLTVVTAILKERYIRELSSSLTAYYICLFFLFICLNLTGIFGGSLAFGLDVW